MTINSKRFVIIQFWMITELHLSGNKLLLYAMLYSIGQGERNVGFEGELEDLRSFASSIFSGTTFYRVIEQLTAQGLIRYENRIFSAVVPEQQSHCETHNGIPKSQNGNLQSQSGTTQTQSGTDNNKIINNNISSKKEEPSNIPLNERAARFYRRMQSKNS